MPLYADDRKTFRVKFVLPGLMTVLWYPTRKLPGARAGDIAVRTKTGSIDGRVEARGRSPRTSENFSLLITLNKDSFMPCSFWGESPH